MELLLLEKLLVTFINSTISRSVVFNMLRQNLREMVLDHSKQRCVLRIFLSGVYRDFTCVDYEAYTDDRNSRFPVLITT